MKQNMEASSEEAVPMEDVSLSNERKRKSSPENGLPLPKQRRKSSDQRRKSSDQTSDNNVLFVDTLDNSNGKSESENTLTDSQDTIGFDLEPVTPETVPPDDLKPGCSTNLSQEENGISLQPKPAMGKIASLQRDSEMIANILDIGEDKIYDKLLRKRAAPNRVEIVTNELLEGDNESGDDRTIKRNDSTASNPELIADVEWVCDQIRQTCFTILPASFSLTICLSSAFVNSSGFSDSFCRNGTLGSYFSKKVSDLSISAISFRSSIHLCSVFCITSFSLSQSFIE